MTSIKLRHLASSLRQLAGPPKKATTQAKLVPAGRIVKGRVAAGSAHRDTNATYTGGCASVGIETAVAAAPTAPAPTCAREERTIKAPTTPAPTGSGSGRAGSDRADRGCTSNGVTAEIGTDAIGAAHRAAMNASNRARCERTADNGLGL